MEQEDSWCRAEGRHKSLGSTGAGWGRKLKVTGWGMFRNQIYQLGMQELRKKP